MTLGASGLVSHPKQVAENYNKLLEQVGIEEMVMHFERFLDTQEFEDFITHVEDCLIDNDITPATFDFPIKSTRK